jgi:hypothetical protein
MRRCGGLAVVASGVAVLAVLWQGVSTARPETYAFSRAKDVRKLNIVRQYEIPVVKGEKNVAGIPALMSFWGATNQQVILDSKFDYSVKPDKIEITADNRGMLRRNYELTWDSPEADSIRVKQTLVVEIACQNMLLTAAKIPYPKEVQERLASSLESTAQINGDNPKVRAAAEAIAKKAQFAEDAVELACDWVNDTIEFQKGSPIASDTVLSSGKANCGGMATLACAVLRCMGIPAEMVDAKFIGGGGHVFMEAYFPDAGWVFYDPCNATRGFKGLDCLLTTGFAFRTASAKESKWHEGDFLDAKDAAPYQEEDHLIGQPLRASPKKHKVQAVRVLHKPTPADVKVRHESIRSLVMDLTIPPGKRQYGKAQPGPTTQIAVEDPPVKSPAKPPAKPAVVPATSKPAPRPRPAATTAPDDPPARKRLKVATMYVTNGLNDKAEPILRQILKDYPNSPEADEAGKLLKDIGKRE